MLNRSNCLLACLFFGCFFISDVSACHVNNVLTSTSGDVITEPCDNLITNTCTLPAVSDIGFTYYDDSMNVLCLIGCAVGFTAPGLDPDLYCAYWDFGDGTTMGPLALADHTHCYNSSGNYTVCLSIVCCDDPAAAVTYCEDIEVICGGAPCEFGPEDIAPLDIIAFEDSPNGVCCFGVCPLLTPDSNADLMSLCIDIDWGDGSAPLLGQAFAACYDHCYGADGTYAITVTVYCCSNPDVSYVITEVVSCGCVPECYIRSSFWANIVGAGFAGDCVTEFDASIFLGPNMISHQNPSWTIEGVPVSNDYVFATLLASGTYNICHTIEGTLNDGTGCEFSSCRDVQVNCCFDSGIGCSDITGDGAVTIADLLQLLANFGAIC